MLARELDNLDAIQDSIDADAAAKAEAADRARESRAREAAAKRRERAERLRRIREDEARETAREVKATRDALFTHTGPYANTSDTFSRSGISPAGIERLKQALPKARISSARMPE